MAPQNERGDTDTVYDEVPFTEAVGQPCHAQANPTIVVPAFFYQWNPIGDAFKIAKIFAQVGLSSSPEGQAEKVLDFMRKRFKHVGDPWIEALKLGGGKINTSVFQLWVTDHPEVVKRTWYFRGARTFDWSRGLTFSDFLALLQDDGTCIEELKGYTPDFLGAKAPKTFDIEKLQYEGCPEGAALIVGFLHALNIPAGSFLVGASPGKLDWMGGGSYHVGVRVNKRVCMHADSILQSMHAKAAYELVPFEGCGGELLAAMIDKIGSLDDFDFLAFPESGEFFDPEQFWTACLKYSCLQHLNLKKKHEEGQVITGQPAGEWFKSYVGKLRSWLFCGNIFAEVGEGAWGRLMFFAPLQDYVGSDPMLLELKAWCEYWHQSGLAEGLEFKPMCLVADPLMQWGAVPPTTKETWLAWKNP